MSGLEMDLKGQRDLTLMPLMTVSAKILCFAQVLSGEEAEVLTCKAERDSETIRICRLWQPHPLHDSLNDAGQTFKVIDTRNVYGAPTMSGTWQGVRGTSETDR